MTLPEGDEDHHKGLVPLLRMQRLSVSCDDIPEAQHLTWHGTQQKKTDSCSVVSNPWGTKMTGTGPHFLLPPTQEAFGSSSRCGDHHSTHNVSEYFEQKQKDDVEDHRGALSLTEQYDYKLSRAQLKASSNTSALLVGFAMVALVELHYDENTPPLLLITLGVVTTLLVSVHLLALMMSTCILPYMEAAGATQDSPHIRLKFFIKVSWLFSTCIGLVLFLIEIAVICYIKFTNVHFPLAAYVTTAMMIPVFVIFVLFSYLIHRSRTIHSIERVKFKVAGLSSFIDYEKGIAHNAIKHL